MNIPFVFYSNYIVLYTDCVGIEVVFLRSMAFLRPIIYTLCMHTNIISRERNEWAVKRSAMSAKQKGGSRKGRHRVTCVAVPALGGWVEGKPRDIIGKNSHQ